MVEIYGSGDTILEELDSPFLPQKSSLMVWEIFIIYDMLNEEWHEELSALRSKACKAVKKKRYMEVFQLCSDFIDNLPSDYTVWEKDFNVLRSGAAKRN